MIGGIFSFVFGGGGNAAGVPEVKEFQLKYDGEAFAGHSIDVNDLAPALMALADLVKEANAIANDEAQTVAIRVKATHANCFEITIQALAAEAQALLIGNKVTALVNLLALLGMVSGAGVTLLKLVKWLAGKMPAKVTPLEGGEVEIETKQGKLVVGRLVWEFYRSRAVMRSVYGVLRPLEKPGVETVEFIEDKKKVTTVQRDELPKFAPPEEAKQVLQELPERDTFVNVVHMWFKDGHKWRFSEGGAEWTAEITDQKFNERLLKGEISIRAHDFLKVRVKQTQFIQGSDISSTFEVTSVLDHKAGGQQGMLL